MKLLYIEDDKIDQMALKRFADSKGITVSIADSKAQALSILEQGNFDFILIDFFLGDATAQDIMHFINFQHVGIFTDENNCEDINQTNSLYYFTKPLDNKQFQVIADTQLNLTYFDSLTDEDNEFKKEILTLGIQTIPLSLSSLSLAFESKNFEKIKFEAHKLKSGVRVFGFDIIEDLESIEQNALLKDKDLLNQKIQNVIKKTSSGLISLQNLLQQLEQI